MAMDWLVMSVSSWVELKKSSKNYPQQTIWFSVILVSFLKLSNNRCNSQFKYIVLDLLLIYDLITSFKVGFGGGIIYFFFNFISPRDFRVTGKHKIIALQKPSWGLGFTQVLQRLTVWKAPVLGMEELQVRGRTRLEV